MFTHAKNCAMHGAGLSWTTIHVVKKCLKHLTYNYIFHKQVCCFSTTNIQGHRKETVRQREDRGLHFLFSFWPLLNSNVNMGGGLSKDVLESKVSRVLCCSYYTLFLLVGTLLLGYHKCPRKNWDDSLFSRKNKGQTSPFLASFVGSYAGSGSVVPQDSFKKIHNKQKYGSWSFLKTEIMRDS